MKDPLFEKTVIFICEHDKHGAMGLIINKEINKKDISFSNQENDKVEAYNLNIAGYILKPLSMDSFISAVATLKNYWQLCEFPE